MTEVESNVIVAIPSQDDYVWELSSEKIPHMTLLYLDDISKSSKLDRIVNYIQHVVSVSLPRFELEVDHRGVLGDENADVLFFAEQWLDKLKDFRTNLLENTELFTAYSAMKQYPEWTSHLTMGYPETPAKPDPREYRGIKWVNFDRVALWTSDYNGPTFLLPQDDSLVVSMSNLESKVDIAAALTLAHHGVKGMKWGVIRRDRSASSGPSEVSLKPTKPGTFVKTTGGQRHTASPDAVSAAKSRQKAKKSTTDSLSNQELQHLVTRMNLEQQYSRLSKQNDRSSNGVRFVKNLFKVATKPENQKQFKEFSNSEAGTKIKEHLKKTAAKAA